MTEPDSGDLRRACLRHVLQSSAFARCGQLRLLLEFLVERAIDGVVPSEYEVAIGPLHRPAEFDPQSDSLVRKEMNRLRNRLRTYYGAEGSADTLRIVSADGYRVLFTHALADRPTGGRIRVLVLPLRATAVAAEYVEAFYDQLLIGLSGISQIQLIAQTTARFYAHRSCDIRALAAEAGADYVIEGTARNRQQGVVTTVWPVEGRTGHVGTPCLLAAGDPEEQATRAAACLGERIAPAQVLGAAT